MFRCYTVCGIGLGVMRYRMRWDRMLRDKNDPCPLLGQVTGEASGAMAGPSRFLEPRIKLANHHSAHVRKLGAGRQKNSQRS